MTVVVSKVKTGLLTFTPVESGGSEVPFSCGVTNVVVNPNSATGAATETEYVLCGDKIPQAAGSEGLGDTLDFTIVSDHNVSSGMVAFSWANRDKVTVFEFVPDQSPNESGASSQMWRGTVTMQPLAVGGDVNGDIRPNVSLSVLSLVPPTGFGVGYPPPKSTAYPGAVFAAETFIDAEDATNAAKLAQLGFVAKPDSRAWVLGEYITIGQEAPQYDFYWDGAAWQPGQPV